MEIHVELAAETLFHIGPVPVTNSMLMMFIVMALIILVGRAIAGKAQVVPGRAQGAFEVVVEFLLNLVENTAGKRLGRRIFPLVGALFIYIIIANYSGLLPGVGTIGYYHDEPEEEETIDVEETTSFTTTYDVAALTTDAVTTQPSMAQEGTATADDGEHTEAEGAAVTTDERAEEEEHGATHEVLVPYFRAPNADLNMTLAMALITFGTVQVLGVRAHGIVGRLKHMADPPLMFPIEVISELSRIISLSARLFGNVFAGEVLLAVMVALTNAVKIAAIPFVFPVVFLFLEVLFGFIQALVFALLTLIYITLAAADTHGDEEHAHGDGHDAHPVPAPTPVATGAGD
jgi:F-type H+-transporting ATPase subunit a